MLKLGIAAIAVCTIASCATAPETKEEKASLEHQASVALGQMRIKDPGLDAVLTNSVGYAVFPNIGTAAFIGGAAYGKGVLYEHGQPTGFVKISQATVGAQAGAQSYAQLIVIQDPNALARLKAGQYDLAANLSAVVLTAGAAAGADFRSGTAVFQMPHGGAMVAAAVGGQHITYVPAG
jgi:lipid-binding SYLF domain-containing protein